MFVVLDVVLDAVLNVVLDACFELLKGKGTVVCWVVLLVQMSSAWS